MRFAWFFVICITTAHASWGDEPSYTQKQDVVYAEVHGTGLLMDVFTPTGATNGRAIIDVVSGAWFSDRGKIRDHTTAQLYSIFCSRGYIVFAIRPGSKSRYTVLEMDQHVKLAIRRVKQIAGETVDDLIKFDATKIGMTGASAGGHLATLAALTPVDALVESKNRLEHHDSSVAAVAVFFPPTDFVQWRDDQATDPKVLASLLAVGATSTSSPLLADKTPDELREMARAISPLHRVRDPKPPFLLIHGDADPVVPLSHSKKLVEAIKAAGGRADLIIKEGGGHPWLTMPIEVALMADWFDQKLK